MYDDGGAAMLPNSTPEASRRVIKRSSGMRFVCRITPRGGFAASVAEFEGVAASDVFVAETRLDAIFGSFDSAAAFALLAAEDEPAVVDEPAGAFAGADDVAPCFSSYKILPVPSSKRTAVTFFALKSFTKCE